MFADSANLYSAHTDSNAARNLSAEYKRLPGLLGKSFTIDEIENETPQTDVSQLRISMSPAVVNGCGEWLRRMVLTTDAWDRSHSQVNAQTNPLKKFIDLRLKKAAVLFVGWDEEEKLMLKPDELDMITSLAIIQ